MATIKETTHCETKDKHSIKYTSKVEPVLKDNSKLHPEKDIFPYSTLDTQKMKRSSTTKKGSQDDSKPLQLNLKVKTPKDKMVKNRSTLKDKDKIETPMNDFNHNNVTTNRNDVIVQYDDEDPKYNGTTIESKTGKKIHTQRSKEVAKLDLEREKNSAMEMTSDENDELSKVVWTDTSPKLTRQTLESLNGETLSNAVDSNSKYVDLWLDIMREYVCLWKDIEDRDTTDVSEHETPKPIMSPNGEKTEQCNGAYSIQTSAPQPVKNIRTTASINDPAENEPEEEGIKYTDLGEISNETPECYDNWDINDFTLVADDSDDGITDNPVKTEQQDHSQTEPNYQKEIPFIVAPQTNERTKLLTKDINGVYHPQKTLHEKLHKSYVAKTCVDRAKKLHRENMKQQQVGGTNDAQYSELSHSPQSDIDSVYAWTLNGTEFASDNEDAQLQNPRRKIPTINEEDLIYESAINNCHTPSQQNTSTKQLTKKPGKKLAFMSQNRVLKNPPVNLKRNKTTSKVRSYSDPSQVNSQECPSIHDQRAHVRSQSAKIQKQHTNDCHSNKPESSTRWQHKSSNSSKHYISESEATVYEFDKVIQRRRKREEKHFTNPLKNPVLLNGGGKYYIMVPRPIESLDFDSEDSESVHSYDSQCEACNNGNQETFSDTESIESFDSQCEACIENHNSSLASKSNTEQRFLPNWPNHKHNDPEEHKFISSPKSMTSPRSLSSTPRSGTSSQMSMTSTPRSRMSMPRSYHQEGNQAYVSSKIGNSYQQSRLNPASLSYSSYPCSRTSVSASQQSEIESDYGTESEHTAAYAIGPIHSIRSAHVDFHN
ncbi:unnamed protein product, partial [Owenia fusiformis]